MLWFIPLGLFSQELSNLDYVSPFHDGLAAVKKGTQWAFIDTKGNVAIDFRSDLVVDKQSNRACCPAGTAHDYPFFSNGRSMIVSKENGISHYGYIDTKGQVVIEPQFINATPFHENGAIVLEVVKETLGRNEALGKNVVTYSYNELFIDTNGNTLTYLRGPFNLLYSKEKMKTPPNITSKCLNGVVIAIQSNDGLWKIKSIEQ
ncbi:MAG: hypothetical protein Aureis2KO_01270 [Aureisphaera sp.]